MTPTVDDPDALREILATTEALLLDFDGPVCSVFAGFPAHVVADQLRDVLAEGGHTDLPSEVEQTADPFVILFHAATLGDQEARFVESAFRALEADAVRSAKPTTGSHDLIRAWNKTGRPVAIVSNNSVDAVTAYLDLHDLQSDTATISARASPNIHLLKPSPHLVDNAAAILGIPPIRCVLVGDSPGDIHAAHAANVRAVGYANRSGKIEELSLAEPITITTTITLLGDASNWWMP